ncbi:MAG: hypothetical protein MHM6MM_000799 [Cercozoa sp. M6MM]
MDTKDTAGVGWLKWLAARVGGFDVGCENDTLNELHLLFTEGNVLGREESQSRFLAEALVFMSDDWMLPLEQVKEIEEVEGVGVPNARSFLVRSCVGVRASYFKTTLVACSAEQLVLCNTLNSCPLTALELGGEFGRMLVALSEKLMCCPDSELLGRIPMLLAIGLPLCFYASRYALPRISLIWRRPELQSLVRRCWSLMASVLHEHTDISKLPKPLVSRHMTLYADVLQSCAFYVMNLPCPHHTGLLKRKKLDSLLPGSKADVNFRRLLDCCWSLCDGILRMCRTSADFARITSIIECLARVRETPTPVVKSTKWDIFLDRFALMARQVVDLPLVAEFQPCPLTYRLVTILTFTLACLRSRVIGMHDVPYLTEFLCSCDADILLSLSVLPITDELLTRFETVLLAIYSRHFWTQVATDARPEVPLLLSLLPENWTTNRLYVVRQKDSYFRFILRQFWSYVGLSKEHNHELSWMSTSHPLDQIRWDSFQRRITDADPAPIWQAHRDLSVHAWVYNETALLTCPFEYYRRNWLRHMHAMSALPFDKEAGDSNELSSFLTELSESPRCVATFLSRALIKRCVVENQDVTLNWCRRVVRRAVEGRIQFKSRTQQKFKRALVLCGGKLKRARQEEFAVFIDLLISRSMAARQNTIALDEKERPWRYANIEHALRCGVPVAAVNMMMTALEQQSAGLFNCLLPTQSPLEQFMRPLAFCMPLESPRMYSERQLSIEPARLLCFLAWQHLHNNDVDLSGLFAIPLSVDSIRRSCEYMTSLNFNISRHPVVPFVGLRADPRHLTLWSVLASLVHTLSVPKDDAGVEKVKLCVFAYSKMCASARCDIPAIAWMLPFGFCARGSISHGGDSFTKVLNAVPRVALASARAQPGLVLLIFDSLLTALSCTNCGNVGGGSCMPLSIIVRLLQGGSPQDALSDLKQLGKLVRTFQVLLRRMHPLLARACLRLAQCNTHTAVLAASLSWAAYALRQDDRASVFLVVRTASLRLREVVQKLIVVCEKRVRRPRSDNTSGSDTSESDSSESDSSDSDSSTDSDSDTSDSDTSDSDSSDSSDSSDGSTDSDSDSSDDDSDSSDSSDGDSDSDSSTSSDDNDDTSDGDESDDTAGHTNDTDTNTSGTKSNQQGPCPVCLEEECDDPVTLVACGHLFCRDCISSWASRQARCPMCSASLLPGAYDAARQHVSLDVN